MPKFTKSEQAVIDRTAKNGFVAAEMAGGRGPEGGRISFGHREHHALGSLIRKGFYTLIDTRRDMQWMGNGYCLHSYIMRAQRTDKAI